MKHRGFKQAQFFGNAFVGLIGESILISVLVNRNFSPRHPQTLLKNLGVVVGGGNVYQSVEVGGIAFQTRHAHNGYCGGRDVRRVRAAIGARVHRQGVVGCVHCGNHHVLRVNQDHMPVLKLGCVGDGQDGGVGRDGRALIGGIGKRLVFIFKPLDHRPVLANLEFVARAVQAANGGNERRIHRVDQLNNIGNDPYLVGGIRVRSLLLVVDCHVWLLFLGNSQPLLAELHFQVDEIVAA